MPQKLWAAETSGPTAFLTNRTLGAIQSRRRLITYFCFTKIILLHTGIGTPSPAERGTSNEKQQTTSNGGETEKNGNKERKQNETADRRCGTGSISDKEDDGEEDVNKPQMEVEYDIPKGQEDFDAKSNSQVQTSSGFTAETHRSAQIHQKPASSETLSENYNTTQCSTEDNGKLTAPPGNHDVCDNRQRSEDRSPDDLYKEAADKVKERLNSDGNKCANNSVVNYLRFYTREEELSEYFCLTCNEGLWS